MIVTSQGSVDILALLIANTNPPVPGERPQRSKFKGGMTRGTSHSWLVVSTHHQDILKPYILKTKVKIAAYNQCFHMFSFILW